MAYAFCEGTDNRGAEQFGSPINLSLIIKRVLAGVKGQSPVDDRKC
jgi:hypothetical protein